MWLGAFAIVAMFLIVIFFSIQEPGFGVLGFYFKQAGVTLTMFYLLLSITSLYNFYWAMNLLIGKSNFVAPFPLGKMCTQPIWSFPALFNSTDSKSFSLLNFQNLKRKNTWILISIAFTKKSEKWTVRFKAQRVQVIYRMHWHQMRWGSPHKDIDIPWPKPKQHHCQYQWDNVNMWMPPSMIHICCKKKTTPAIWRCTDASGFHWMSNDHVPVLCYKTISFKN